MFLAHGRVLDKKERWEIEMRMICWIRAEMRNQRYNMPDWDSMTLYWG